MFIDAVWHYMRGVRQAARGDVAAAQGELAALRDIAAAADLSAHHEGGMPAADILAIAALVLEARMAQAGDDWAETAHAFAEAKAIEDSLPYMEPRHWYYPVGQSLGAALLRVGDLDGAEEAFKESLALAPNNDWSLFGLSEVYRARGDKAKAEETARQWSDAWTGDTTLLRLERL